MGFVMLEHVVERRLRCGAVAGELSSLCAQKLRQRLLADELVRFRGMALRGARSPAPIAMSPREIAVKPFSRRRTLWASEISDGSRK